MGVRRTALAAAAIAWLDKPYDRNFLVKTVREALSAQEQRNKSCPLDELHPKS